MKNKNRKNVILLVVDSLNCNRLGFYGVSPSPSSTIDELLSSGLTFTNCFSTGCPTQFSLPTLFTSTMPLDKGGYAEGVNTRSVTLAELFKKEGYTTASFYTDANWLDYERGFDERFVLCPLSRFSDWVDGYYADYYARMYRSGQKSIEEITDMVESFLKKVFRSIDLFCIENEKALNAGYFPSPFHLYDYEKIKVMNAAEEARFHENPLAYMKDLLSQNKTESFFTFLRSFDKSANKNLSGNVDRRLRWLLLRSFFTILQHSFTSEPNRKAVRDYLSRFLRGQKGSVKCFSGAYVFDTFFNWMRMRPSNNQPFFAYIHLSDIHDLNFVSYEYAEQKALLKKEIAVLHEFYKKRNKRRAADLGNPLFDFATQYEDVQVARLLSFLQKRGMLDDTLLILTSDHGNSIAAWPVRKNVHVAADFYDELYHVPLAFIDKEIKPQKIDKLCSSLDIAPSVCDFLGLPIPAAFQGKSLITPLDGEDRKFVIMEHLGPGPCDFTSKPINICVRSKTHKLVYQEFFSKESGKYLIKEAYDLLKDPFEKNNIAENISNSPELKDLLSIAKKRVSQIKEEIKS